MNNQYSTLSERINQLKKRGYTHNFEVNSKGELHEINGRKFNPSETTLHEHYRFEGMTNPGDSSILYAIETSTGLKGLVVDAYGVDGSKVISDFMNQIKKLEN